MHRILKLFTTIAIIAVVITVSGCRTTLTPPGNSPFPTQYKVNDSVVVAFPDDIVEREYRVKVGKLWETHVYKVPLFEWYANETSARARGLFSGNVVVTTHRIVDQVLEDEQLNHREGEAEEMTEDRDLETILNEMAEVERGEEVRDSTDRKRSEGELAIEGLREASREEFAEADHGFLILFKEAQLGFIDNRCVISFRVQLIDWRTKNILLDKRYNRGQSSRFTPFQSKKSNEEALKEKIKEAFSGKMHQLMQDVAYYTGAKDMSAPR